MDITGKLIALLLPVFGFDSADQILPEHSLVQDLGAESLDFVEIVFLIEKEFGVKLETKEIVSGGSLGDGENPFIEGHLTEQGLSVIRSRLPYKPERFKSGMSKMEIFQLITVQDLVHIIQTRMEQTHA
jgi:acyl carrier protein